MHIGSIFILAFIALKNSFRFHKLYSVKSCLIIFGVIFCSSTGSCLNKFLFILFSAHAFIFSFDWLMYIFLAKFVLRFKKRLQYVAKFSLYILNYSLFYCCAFYNILLVFNRNFHFFFFFKLMFILRFFNENFRYYFREFYY